MGTMPTPTSPEQAPKQQRSPAEALSALGSGTIADQDIAALSDLSVADARALATAWPLFPESVRVDAVRRAVGLTEEHVHYAFGRLFRCALADDSAVVRQLAIAGLWEDERSDLLPILNERLQADESPDVRAEAAQGLSRFADRAAAAELASEASERLYHALLGAARDEGEALIVRRRSLESVAAFGRRGDVAELIQSAYEDDDAALQASALYAMGRSLDRRWLRTVLDEFESPDAEFRYEAARASGQIGDAEAVTGLGSLAQDEDTEVRHAAIQALGSIGGPGATRTLRALQTSASPVDREVIEEALDEASIVTDPVRLRP